MQKQSLSRVTSSFLAINTTRQTKLDTGLISMQICVASLAIQIAFFYNVPQIVLLKHCIWFPKPPGHPIMSPFILGTKHLLNNLLRLWLSFRKHPNIITMGPGFPPHPAATCSFCRAAGATSVVGSAMICYLASSCSHGGCSIEGFIPVPLI